MQKVRERESGVGRGSCTCKNSVDIGGGLSGLGELSRHS